MGVEHQTYQIGLIISEGEYFASMVREGHSFVSLPASPMLHSAVETGDAAAVASLLRDGQDPNSRTESPYYDNGATALHLATRRGYLEIVLTLLRAGAEPSGCEATKPDCDTDLRPLHEASARGHVEIIKALLSAGELPDCLVSGRKIRDLRIENSGGDVFSERGCGYTPLHLASAFGHADVVRTLVESSASVDVQGGDYDDTPLHLAASGGRVGAMAALLEAGAGIDVGNMIGNTALHVAANISSTEFLLRAGANPNMVAESPYGSCTPLGSYCTLIHRLETAEERVENAAAQVKALLRHGADPRVQANHNYPGDKSPLLSCAAKNGVPGIVSALLGAGLDPNERDHEGWPPLHDAARGDHVEVVRLLLQAGVGINTRTGREGWTPLHVACRYTSVGCVLELLRWGGDLNATICDPRDSARRGRLPLPVGKRRTEVLKGCAETPVEVIGLKCRTAAPLASGGSTDPYEEEDEQMEVFDGENRINTELPSVRHPLLKSLSSFCFYPATNRILRFPALQPSVSTSALTSGPGTP